MYRNNDEVNSWKAQWIGYDAKRNDYDPNLPYYCADDFDKGENKPFLPPCPMFRKEYFIYTGIKSAKLYVSALGLADVWINGSRALSGYMVPGNSDYRKRVYYREYEVANLLKEGINCIAAVLADGWYSGYIGLNPRQQWGDSPRLSLQLQVEYENGENNLFISDESWKTTHGPWLYSDIMHGECYDARLEKGNWTLPGYDDSKWHNVDLGEEINLKVQKHPGVEIVEHAHFSPTIHLEKEQYTIYDMQQCFSGVVKIVVKGVKDARIDIFHSEEVLENDLYWRGNRSAQAHDVYILSGDGLESYQPSFTYHGFRYVKIVITGQAELVSINGVAISSDLPDKTEFETSSKLLNSIFSLISWTQQSNQYEMPTDVCARDERLGWGAEGHFFMHTAAYLNNNKKFLRKWLQDIVDSQMESGAFWSNAPAVMMKDVEPFAGDIQSDMGIHVSWLLINMYDDVETVGHFYHAIEKYFDFLMCNNDRLIRFASGQDWLDIEDSGHSDFQHGFGQCPAGILGTAYFARAATMMADISLSLGLVDKSDYYKSIFAKIKNAFRTYFVQRDGSLREATQGAYCLAIVFNLLNERELKVAAEQLEAKIKSSGGVCCGTATTPIALQALTKVGLSDLAVEWLTSETYPGFGHMISNGATAVWERWDAIRNNKYHPHPMNAFDHIGLATAGEWLISGLAGIFPLEPGFRTVGLKPQPSKKVSSLKTKYKSIHGDIEVDWSLEAGKFRYKCTVPEGVKALIWLPIDQTEVADIVRVEGEVINAVLDIDTIRYEVEAGNYEFNTNYQ